MAIYEVTGKDVYSHMMKKFPKHSFYITEGPQSQEILVGTRNTLHAFTTQRTEFKHFVNKVSDHNSLYFEVHN